MTGLGQLSSNLVKRFDGGGRRRAQPRDRCRRVLLAARRLRLRQDDDAAHGGGIRTARRGRDRARRSRPGRVTAAQAAGQHRLPVVRPVPVPDGGGQRRVRPQVPQGTGPSPSAASEQRSTWSRCRSTPSASHTSSPAASNSASPSPARSSSSRRCCSWTNRSALSTPSSARRCRSSCDTCSAVSRRPSSTSRTTRKRR